MCRSNPDILPKQFQSQKTISIPSTVSSLLDHDFQFADTPLVMKEQRINWQKKEEKKLMNWKKTHAF